MNKTLGVLLIAWALGSPAGAQTVVKCKFVEPGVPIITPGYWCLRGNVVGRGVVIDASDVTLDLKGYSIINDGTATEPLELNGRVVGVLSQSDNNITVRNGIIRGFDYGVHLGYSEGVKGTLLVEKLFVQGSRERGISVLGYHTANIIDNVVTGTTGTHHALGIHANGRTDPNNNYANVSVVNILGNRVHDTEAGTGGGSGISVSEAASVTVENNVVTDVYSSSSSFFGTGITVHQRLPFTSAVRYNTVINTRAVENTIGISVGHGTGIPAFTGTVDASLGLVTGSRIQGFTRGVNSLSSQLIGGVHKTVVSYTYTNNVVAGATGKAYAGGLMAARSNRTE